MCGITLILSSSKEIIELKQFFEKCKKLLQLASDVKKDKAKQQITIDQIGTIMQPDQERIFELLKKRGPDYQSIQQVKSNQEELTIEENQQESKDNTLTMKFAASVLGLRGSNESQFYSKQPIIANQSMLIFNGQIYYDSCNYQYNPQENDGVWLFQQLNKIVQQNELDQKRKNLMQNLLFQSIEAQFSLIFYNASSKQIFIAKDRIGRRSLLIWTNQNHSELVITSVFSTANNQHLKAKMQQCYQIPPGQLITLDLKQNKMIFNQQNSNKLSDLRFNNPQKITQLQFLNQITEKIGKNFTNDKFFAEYYQKYVSCKKQELHNEYFTLLLLYLAVKSRVINISNYFQHQNFNSKEQIKSQEQNNNKVAILFSGGIDSTLLALLTHFAIPEDETIQLFNISFDPKDAPDRITSIIAFYQLKRQFNLIQCKLSFRLFPKRKYKLICIDKQYQTQLLPQLPAISQLIYPSNTQMDLNIGAALYFASKGIGYQFEESQQLLKVLQQQAQTMQNSLADPEQFKELIKTMKKVPHDYKILSKVLKPIPVQMYTSSSKPIYRSKARVLLSGLGADQVFGGYARYSSGFISNGYKGIQQEMAKDLNRLWVRNLGRDDRCISNNSKQCRYPFLDSNLIKGISLVPLQDVCNFQLPRGQGQKKIIREIAKLFGIRQTLPCVDQFIRGIHGLQKRAIQFGTKIAKFSNIKQFGSNRKANGKAQFTQPNQK